MGHSESEWFNLDEFWAELFPFMFSDESFARAADSVAKVTALAGVSAGHLLDLACGPGRFAIPFAKAGYAVTGVDRTRILLDKGRERAGTDGAKVEWVEQDMREFVREGAFDLAINMYTSFGYFDDEDDNCRVLQNVLKSLKPGGVLVLDHIGKEVLASRFQPTLSDVLSNGKLLIQRVSVCGGWSRVNGEWMLIADNQVKSFHIHHWLYSGQEIRQLMLGAGFADVALYGSLEGTPYDQKAQRLIAVATKSAE